jgi:lysozyme
MTLRGIDISRWQGTTPSLAGLAFCFVKATEGQTTDPKYAMHAANVRKAGIVLGAYAFGHRGDGAGQARHLLEVARGADLLALDVEGADAPDYATARDFGAAIHAAGREWGLYHSSSGYPQWGQDFLWVADWTGGSSPHLAGWHFWQYRGSPLDLDLFNGTQAQLDALAHRAAPAAVHHYQLSIASRAKVMVAIMSGSRIAGWTTHAWGPRASSAPCGPKIRLNGLNSGWAYVAKVAAGEFAGRYVRIGTGVTVREV